MWSADAWCGGGVHSASGGLRLKKSRISRVKSKLQARVVHQKPMESWHPDSAGAKGRSVVLPNLTKDVNDKATEDVAQRHRQFPRVCIVTISYFIVFHWV